MRIVRIIVDPTPTLYAIQFPEYDVNELDRNFDLWNNPEYLKDFFSKNSGDLRGYNQFHNRHYSVQDAVTKTLDDAENLEHLLLDVAERGNEDETEVLQTFFRQLDDMETSLFPLQKSKGKLQYNSWLRLYAIRIDKHLYVITGGAIKLTKKMNERNHKQVELQKMEKVVGFLRSKHLINEGEFKRF
ncbi:MAG: hypothetical protein RI575_11085 [Balneolaceae bacterium]|nr:hypothetical protein [Balneolaceae bacterium]MDR9410341.1 hypothetical protein [Balneolaceae bacterium]